LQAIVTTTDDRVFHLTNLSWDADFTPGVQLNLQFQYRFASGTRPNLVAAYMDGQEICGNGMEESTPATTSYVPTTITTQTPVDGEGCSNVVTVLGSDAEQHTSYLSVHLTPAADIAVWVVNITFASAVDDVLSQEAEVTGSGTGWQLANKAGNGGIAAGQTLELLFSVQHFQTPTCPPVVGVSFGGTAICNGKARF